MARIRASDGSLELVAQDKTRLQWPDGFSFGPGNWLYLTTSALHIKFGGGKIADHAPYFILRMKVPVGGAPGH